MRKHLSAKVNMYKMQNLLRRTYAFYTCSLLCFCTFAFYNFLHWPLCLYQYRRCDCGAICKCDDLLSNGSLCVCAWQFDKHTFNLALCLDFIAVTAKNAENAILYKQTVVDGSRTLTALSTVLDTLGTCCPCNHALALYSRSHSRHVNMILDKTFCSLCRP